ncbi:MAG: S8 family serine peptidase, partial [Planctomycetota bacterium]
DSHGAATSGICFGDGTGNPNARGLLPEGQGIVADYNTIGLTGPNRHQHTGELIGAPYFAVFQTASVGSDRTTQYTTISADTDASLFEFDIVHCQSQSNAGDQMSRPQAWAKNIISGGGVYHYDTLDQSDDCWCGGASIGPATDGRIKPDLCAFYDDILTTTTGSPTSYTNSFGGTSGATPIICGHVGLFFQMWADGIFGNELPVPGGTVFENRAHMTTAKAVMINTANQYAFTGTGHDLTRTHQGWGWPDLGYLYDMRDKISIIDETELLGNMESIEFVGFIESGEPEMRVTLVYADPPGLPSSSQHRINDLTLKVTSPSATVYWGNNGLLEGNWSVPGGTANVVDTVENVFVQDPEPGVWAVEVIASEVNEDSHVETPTLDADFALVFSGGQLATCTSQGVITLHRSKYACASEANVRVVDCDLNTDDLVVETVSVTVDSTTEPAGETLVLTETAAETADFRATIELSTVDAPGVLQVSEGDVVTATYIDADDGEGGINVVVTDVATVDCTSPTISNVQTSNIEPRSATVTFDTDEPARGTVRYGLDCGALTEATTAPGFNTAHTVNLSGLVDETTYFFAIDAEDEAGNVATDDNGGTCYAFTTPDIPNFFTEQFGGDNDLDNLTLSFVPNGSPDFYAGCAETIGELPTDPTGGSTISLSDDSSQQITLTGGQAVWLYGVSYSSFFVGSNGYVTFGSGDSDYDETLPEHFELPRISALYDDLNPSSGGLVSWKQLADRAVVTYENVPEYSTSNSNTFQIEMYFNGDLRVSFLDIAASDGIAGLSEGNGLDPGFFETDLSE